MIEKEIQLPKMKGYVVDFKSLEEYYEYLCNTPFNEAFRWANHSSVSTPESFSGTSSFEQAVDLMKNGWSEMASILQNRIKVEQLKLEPSQKRRTSFDVVGYQASVPRYLQGIPTSMVNSKNVPCKQKVITLNKMITYNSITSTEQIKNESIKTLMIIMKLEKLGYRINLNIVDAERNSQGKIICTKIRIKNAGERINISKMAFPLVHPSMLRRLTFRFTEVYPRYDKTFVGNYGVACSVDEVKKMIGISKGEYVLPNFIKKDLKQINSLDDLQNM